MVGRLALLRHQPFLNTEDESGGAKKTDDPPTLGGKTGGSEGEIKFTPEEQAFINALVAKEKREAKAAAKAEADAAATAAEEERRATAAAEEAKKRGDFEAVENQLKADVETAKSEAKRLKAENDTLREAMKTGIEARWKDVPEKIAKLYKGDEADVIGRWNFLNDPDVAELVKDLSGSTAKRETDSGTSAIPPRGVAAPKDDEAARAINSMRYS